ncbi:choline O-acetyltransferase [Elysia marginata]|uniref:Choline O-acetyltransferase n=1 Tax=Elysia marginata TaxID=1093978 RepID=A0AAV4IAJ7_9GAST|nr:choline O-acetyltransferase [Elysia marginata]
MRDTVQIYGLEEIKAGCQGVTCPSPHYLGRKAGKLLPVHVLLVTRKFLRRKHALPKLPVPELQSTLDKYLSLIRTVVSPSEYARTKRIVEQFLKPGGQGDLLQEYLLQRQHGTDNWANKYWLNDMYLNIPLPLMINSNPAAVFSYQNFLSRREQIRFTAKFVRGMLDFKYLTDT